MMVIQSTQGLQVTLSESNRYRTLEAMLGDADPSGLVVKVPFKDSVVSLIDRENVEELNTRDCHRLIKLMEFLGCYEMVEAIGHQIIELSCLPRLRGSLEVGMILGATPSIGSKAVLMRLIDIDLLVTPSQPVVVKKDLIDGYIKYITGGESADGYMTDLIVDLLKMNLRAREVALSLRDFYNPERNMHCLFHYLLKLGAIEILACGLERGHYRNYLCYTLVEVALNSPHHSIIKIIIDEVSGYHWDWLFKIAINCLDPRIITYLTFTPERVRSTYGYRTLIEVKHDLTEHIKYLFGLDETQVRELKTHLIKHLLLSSHYREINWILKNHPNCARDVELFALILFSGSLREVKSNPLFDPKIIDWARELYPNIRMINIS